MGKVTKAQFRKYFLGKVQGERVEVKPLQPAPLAPEHPPDYWANRLLECGAINQATLDACLIRVVITLSKMEATGEA